MHYIYIYIHTYIYTHTKEKMLFLTLSCFFQTTTDFHGTLNLDLSLVCMRTAAGSEGGDFRCLPKSIKLVSDRYHIFIAYINIDK